MILFDVNVLLYSHRLDSAWHEEANEAVHMALNGDAAFAVSDSVLQSFIRIATSSRILDPPTELNVAIDFAEALRHAPTALVIEPGRRHWRIFTRLLRESNASGDLVPDVFLAALAIESGSTLVSADSDFARFPGLRWENPLAKAP